MSGKNGQIYEFGKFQLDTENPGLWLDGELVAVPPKAMEVLILLVERHGEIVSREELLDSVWRDTFVEEANINYTVSLLRKALGKKDKSVFIQTVPKRGYRFVAKVSEVSKNGKSEAPAAAPAAPPKKQSRLYLTGLILTGVLFLTSFAAWWNFSYRKGVSGVPVSERNIRSVAVLPLKSLNDDDQSRATAIGLTDSLISRLGSLNRFAVRPLNTVKDYAESGKGPLKFGGELKVDAVLEGTLQSVENRLRVNIRLWDTRDGAQLWQDTFDETETDIFSLQDILAAQTAQSLLKQLTGQEREILGKRFTENAEAWRAYVRGRAILDRRNPEHLENAIDQFQKAVAFDPTFAVAYGGLADAFLRKINAASGRDGDEYIEKTRLYAQKALQLESESDVIYTTLGRIKRTLDWDWAGAEADFRRAIEINPNQADAHLYHAQLLAFLGRADEALAAMNKAVEINPISTNILQARFAILESRGDYAEGLRLAEEYARFDKENLSAKRSLATFLYHHGEFAKVIELGEPLLPKSGWQKYAFLSLLSGAYQRSEQSGKASETLEELEELAQTDTKALYSLAMNYAELGRADEALEALEKCVALREERIIWLNVEPRFANLKTDSRFRGIVRKLNLAG